MSRRAAPPQASLGWQRVETGGQREPYEWSRATVWTLREVEPRDLTHPLDHMLWAASGWLGGLAQQCPTAAQGPRLVPVGEEAIMPETHEAAPRGNTGKRKRRIHASASSVMVWTRWP